MSIFASKSTRGFYSDEIHGDNMPSDVVEITESQHADLISAPSRGLLIDWSGHVPVAIPHPTLTGEQLRARKMADVNAAATDLLAMLSAAYPDGEVQSWGQQTREAEALALNPSAPAPLLTAIAAARGLPLAELAARVREKVQAYAVASGQIIGQRQALEDKLLAIDLASPDAEAQINAVRWESA